MSSVQLTALEWPTHRLPYSGLGILRDKSTYDFSPTSGKNYDSYLLRIRQRISGLYDTFCKTPFASFLGKQGTEQIPLVKV